MGQNAFVLRIAPAGVDRVPEALREDQLIIGWADAEGLLTVEDWDDFREIVRASHYADDTNRRRAGAAAGHLWRFIRDMNEGDLVVVPHGSGFYIAKVAGPAFFDESKQAEDAAYRRPAEWLNDKRPIPRSIAKSALISRMKTQGTCADATDLHLQIVECLQAARSGTAPSFAADLQARLIEQTLDELRNGRMESFAFERLIETVLKGLGSVETWIVPRKEDKGVDIYGVFLVAGVFRQVVAVQAKHWQAEPPVGRAVVEQLVGGIEQGKEAVSLGMIITSGTIGDDAYAAAEACTESKGIPIELIDGLQFSKLIVEHGIRPQFDSDLTSAPFRRAPALASREAEANV